MFIFVFVLFFNIKELIVILIYFIVLNYVCKKGFEINFVYWLDLV